MSDPCDTVSLYDFIKAINSDPALQTILTSQGVVAAGNAFSPGFGDSLPAGAPTPTLAQISDYLSQRDKNTHAFGTDSGQLLTVFAGTSDDGD